MWSPPDAPEWVYLDTNVLRYMFDGLSGDWYPPPNPSETDLAILAAVRLRFYAYLTRNRWTLCTSRTASQELMRRDRYEWVLGTFLYVEAPSDAVPQDAIQLRVKEYEQLSIRGADALHLAWADLTPWVDRFVTNDVKLRRRAARASVNVRVLSPVEAEAELQIAPGEAPPIRLLPEHPLSSGPPWWIPDSD
jgi:hypothetical protein